MFKDKIDTKLSSWRRSGTHAGDIGIELELEGNLKFMPPSAKFWLAKEEGSLRGGMEYILKEPVRIGDLPEALQELEASLRTMKPKASIRCSTHFHVNVNSLTVRQIYNILGYYYLIENLLVSTQGPLRIGNLFCLRLTDAESAMDSVLSSIRSKEYFRAFNISGFKYGAVNLAAPWKFGSLEFRFFRPILDMRVMEMWAKILYGIVHQAAHIPLDKACSALSAGGLHNLLDMTLSSEQISFILAQVNQNSVAEDLFQNFDHVCKMSYLLTRKEKFVIPDRFLDDDLSEEPFRLELAAHEELMEAAEEAAPFPNGGSPFSLTLETEDSIPEDLDDYEDDFTFDED